jgi:hypothetical protein
MTSRLERLIPRIKDRFVREFLASAEDKGSAAGHYVLPALETLAEKWLALEQEVEKCSDRR